jgi:hypothetical protein
MMLIETERQEDSGGPLTADADRRSGDTQDPHVGAAETAVRSLCPCPDERIIGVCNAPVNQYRAVAS